MLNKLRALIRRYDMVETGDRVVCAVSGGADSMALLWAFYLLRDSLKITLSAAHYNHGLRGEESDRDEAFVRQFCADYHIPFVSQKGKVTPGKKGLEAAARDARYDFLKSLEGKIATAHTANDNAETVLMHLVRGTGLKGLGGITPVNGRLIRPMLSITRQEVLAFLEEYSIPYVTDSSNETDLFLRNRLRRRVMPLLQQENPRLAEKLSAMALELREDEAALTPEADPLPNVQRLQAMQPAMRKRTLAAFLQSSGVKEPEREHIALAEELVFSQNPSAAGDFPGGVRLRRCYDTLLCETVLPPLTPVSLAAPGMTPIPELSLQVTCTPGRGVQVQGKPVLRCREAGDLMTTQGGTKSLKKLFIDRKIPAHQRLRIPVIADEQGVLWVQGFGYNQSRLTEDGVSITVVEL